MSRVQPFVAILGSALALTVAGCSFLSPEASQAAHRARGLAYLEKGRYHEAAVEFRHVLQVNPENADALYHLALSRLKLGTPADVQAALSALERSVERDPGNRDAQLSLGDLYLLVREPAKARARAETVLASAPQDADGLVLRGRSLVLADAVEEGITDLVKAIKVAPAHIRAHVSLAQAYLKKHDRAAAETTLHRALFLAPRSTEVRLALGDFHQAMGQPQRAEFEYRQALETDPENAALYVKLGRFYQRQREWDQAEAVYRRWLANTPTADLPLIFLGDLYTETGREDLARVSYRKAAEMNPDSTFARNKLILHYLDAGRPDEAEPLIKPILDRNPKDLIGRYFQARVALARGRPDEAITLLRQVLQEEPRSGLAHFFLGLAYADKQDLTQARRELGAATMAAPAFAEARTALAAIHLAEGAFDLALNEARQALALKPGSLYTARLLGDTYLRKGELARARQVFETILKVVPKDAQSHYRLGLIARTNRRDAQALHHFEEALAVDPDSIDGLVQVVSLELAEGKPLEARARVQQQEARAPDNPMIHNVMGRLWLQAKDFRRAEAAFKHAIALNPALAVSYRNLAELYAHTGRLDEAEREYRSALERDSTLPAVHVLLGMIAEQRNQVEKAKTHYQEALRLAPRFVPAANSLAWLYAERIGDMDAALALAQTAREQQPQDPAIADTLGWIYYKKKAYLRAITLLKEADERLPDNPLVQYHLGMTYYRLGERAAAMGALSLSLQSGQNFQGADQAREVLQELEHLLQRPRMTSVPISAA